MAKRYQVFVSSTYTDLKEVRQKIQQALLAMGCFPAGMELFPATDEEQFEYIKKVIDDCDYYLLIIAGRYGSIAKDGKSYTEKEFDYAISKGVHVIAFIHNTPGTIPFDNSEQDPGARALLDAFKVKVKDGRVIKPWDNASELPGLVALSLNNAITMHPAIGWEKADRIASVEALAELNEVRKENISLTTRLASLLPPSTTGITDLAGLDEKFTITGTHFVAGATTSWQGVRTWAEIFSIISPYLLGNTNGNVIRKVLCEYFGKHHHHNGNYASVDDQDFQTILIQFVALGLVATEVANTIKGGAGTFWSATEAGQRLTYELRTVRSQKQSS